MTEYFRALKSCAEDWDRFNLSEREHLLEVLDLPKSEAACEWDQLRPQVRAAMIEFESDCTEMIAREA